MEGMFELLRLQRYFDSIEFHLVSLSALLLAWLRCHFLNQFFHSLAIAELRVLHFF